MDKNIKRKGKFSIAEVFEYIDAAPHCGQLVDFHGDMIHMRSPRLLNFRYHGIVCVECGTRGAFFAKESFGQDKPHLNLYGFNKQGQEVLMTRDHIMPRAKGGTNLLYNLQPMCYTCNNKKSATYRWTDRLRHVVSMIKHKLLRIPNT